MNLYAISNKLPNIGKLSCNKKVTDTLIKILTDYKTLDKDHKGNSDLACTASLRFSM